MSAVVVNDAVAEGRNVFETLARGGSFGDNTEATQETVHAVEAQMGTLGFNLEQELSPDAILGMLESEEAAMHEAVSKGAAEAPVTTQDVVAEAESQFDDVDLEDISDSQIKGKNAQARIRELVKQRNELRAKLDEEARNQALALQQRMDEQNRLYQQQISGVYEQNKLLASQVEKALTEREENELPAHKKWEKELISNQEKALRAQIEAAINPYKHELEKLKSEREQAIRDQQMRERMEYFQREAAKARDAVLFKDLLKDDTQDMASQANEFILTNAAAFKQTPQDAASEAQKFLDKYFKARLKAETAKRKQVVEKSQNAPAVAGAQRGAATGFSAPTYSREQIRQAGYNNYFDAMTDNFRRLRG